MKSKPSVFTQRGQIMPGLVRNLNSSVTMTSTDSRTYAVEFDNLSRCDGSALMSLGETIIQAAVYGPSEAKMNKERYDRAVLEVSFRPKVGQSAGCPERLKEHHIAHAVEAAIMTVANPRTLISIILQEIQDNGNSLACSINSACLALIDAGIPMKCMVGAVSAVVDKNGDVITFPSQEQQKDCGALMTFSFSSSSKDIVDVHTVGCYSEKDFEKCLQTCKEAVEDIFSFFRESITRKYSKDEACVDE